MATIKQFADIHDLEIFLALCDERYFRYSEYGVTSIDDLLSKTLAEETYAKKEDVPNISGLISRSEVELRYLSQSAAQDLYATKSEL